MTTFTVINVDTPYSPENFDVHAAAVQTAIRALSSPTVISVYTFRDQKYYHTLIVYSTA